MYEKDSSQLKYHHSGWSADPSARYLKWSGDAVVETHGVGFCRHSAQSIGL